MAGQKKPYQIIKPTNSAVIDGLTLNRVQQQLESVINPISQTEIINGVLFENLSLNDGYVNLVQHGLGRACNNYIITNRSCFFLDMTQPSGVDLTLYLPLVVSFDCVINLWCF